MQHVAPLTNINHLVMLTGWTFLHSADALILCLQYHLISLARDGLDNVLEAMDSITEEQKKLIKTSVCVVNADGSVDEVRVSNNLHWASFATAFPISYALQTRLFTQECAPLTMTIKSRVYSFGAPRSVEIRHEYHRREGWVVFSTPVSASHHESTVLP